ncbi:MAG: site-2 protease family protein [Elusimicrobia bacterium]|nr:site-2 protease family protein [Elusimicrobiota bacterium]
MEWVIQLPILLFSIIFHEVAHGRVALRHGDDTAARLGRLSFNPLDHLDPLGTVILPLLCWAAGAPLLGWAKPVPVNPANFDDPRKGMMRVAAAGPLSNLALCLGAVLVFRVGRMAPLVVGQFQLTLLHALLYTVHINMVLAFFNLIPIHPLDGSRILAGLLPPRLSASYQRHAPFGIAIILLLASLRLIGPLLAVPTRLFLGILSGLGLI